mgnify:CR=1 FL=1
MTPATIQDMQAALAHNTAMVIDIREPHEHATGVAAGAVLMPIGQIGARLAEIPKPNAALENNVVQEVLIVCRTQGRSPPVAMQLVQMGYSNVRYVRGGMSEWASLGLPMVAPQSPQ